MTEKIDFFEKGKEIWKELDLPENDERLWTLIHHLMDIYNDGVNHGTIEAYQLSINLINFKKNEKLESVQKK